MAKKTKKSKEDRLKENLLKTIREFLSSKKARPLSFDELIQKLKILPEHAPLIKELLQSLVNEGEVSFSLGRYSYEPSIENEDLLKGTIKMHPRGFGFVIPDDRAKFPEDIFIPRHFTMNAVDGDKVEVLVSSLPLHDKGPEGKVLNILERSRRHLAGIIREFGENEEPIVYVPMLGANQRVILKQEGQKLLAVGDRIVIEVLEWGTKQSVTVARLLHKIGHISDPACDIPAAIEEYDLKNSFSPLVLKEAEKFGKRIKPSDLKGRRDLRNDVTFTIDPDTAKDFDDALTLTKDKKGHYFLGVHIADVSHYVKAGSYLDEEAKNRANSTYFPGVCVPMLPKELSENLCSLKANVARLTASVFMEFDPLGELVSYSIDRSVIKSVKRLTYREAFAILQGKKKSPLKENLELMVELCRLLKRKRIDRGSVDLALPDLVVLVDPQGNPTGIDTVEYDITHQLVEEFMLKANEMVATHLDNLGKNLAFRVHDEPASENIQDFVKLTRSFGFEMPDKPTSYAIQKLFNEAVKSPYGQYLATSYIRRMKMAYYSPENIGHYGLGLTHYCHFTSPIRRYADLIVHRILFGDEDNLEYLEEATLHCSEQERVSAKAEMSVILLKKLRLIQKEFIKDPYQEYKAVVTSIKPFGITIEVLPHLLDGFIHISEIGNDFFDYDEQKMQLRGKRSKVTYNMGDTVNAVLKSIDLIMQESKWELLPQEGEKNLTVLKPKKNKKSRKEFKKLKKSKRNRKKR